MKNFSLSLWKRGQEVKYKVNLKFRESSLLAHMARPNLTAAFEFFELKRGKDA